MKTTLLVLLILFSTLLNAQDGRAIVRLYEKEMESTDQEAMLTMKLISKNGSTRERTLIISNRTDKSNRDASYIYFSAPADIKGTAFLSVENEAGNDDQWLFLPTLKRSRRISSNEKGKSFLGTDFTYEDLGSEKSSGITYKYLRSEQLGNIILQVVEAVYTNPTRSKETGYSKRILFINSENNMLVKTEFYGIEGTLKKILDCSNFEYYADSKKWRPKTLIMKNMEKETQTILQFEYYKINKGIDPNRFTLRNLESN
jgi:outer membrane lipoprotein-sorting protein